MARLYISPVCLVLMVISGAGIGPGFAMEFPFGSKRENAEKGIVEIELDSPHQDGPTRVEVLLPDRPEPGKKYPVLYILPVGGAAKRAFGDGLQEARQADLANKYGVICVQPYFSLVPWLGNHATDPKIQQERHLLETVVPMIDATFPTQADPEGRWLIGFSKGGWAAITQLLRNPETFGYAAAWDVPFMLTGDNSGPNWGPMGLKRNFGTKEAMQQSLPTKLAEQNADWLKERPRLVIGVGEFWKGPSTKYHQFLEQRGIPHAYRDDLVLKHRWDTGWFEPIAVELIGTARAPGSAP
ncbi:MAG: alpha/beta hydrolase-fold protein [Verrucomicrobiota bacterium]